MEEFNKMKQSGNSRDENVISIPVRAGKRTYFFDLKKTRSNSHYLVITESLKNFDDNQLKNTFQKQRIFIFEEGLTNFLKALNAITDYAKENNFFEKETENENQNISNIEDDFMRNIGFDDIEGK